MQKMLRKLLAGDLADRYPQYQVECGGGDWLPSVTLRLAKRKYVQLVFGASSLTVTDDLFFSEEEADELAWLNGGEPLEPTVVVPIHYYDPAMMEKLYDQVAALVRKTIDAVGLG